MPLLKTTGIGSPAKFVTVQASLAQHTRPNKFAKLSINASREKPRESGRVVELRAAGAGPWRAARRCPSRSARPALRCLAPPRPRPPCRRHRPRRRARRGAGPPARALRRAEEAAERPKTPSRAWRADPWQPSRGCFVFRRSKGSAPQPWKKKTAPTRCARAAPACACPHNGRRVRREPVASIDWTRWRLWCAHSQRSACPAVGTTRWLSPSHRIYRSVRRCSRGRKAAS
mmetsp:Transcript_36179/g.92108  ORF Transcript_36179/g.92108 Transcript_36179/m.92108 type:complete len:230 (-) Transcript_36179:724-1413(-)